MMLRPTVSKLPNFDVVYCHKNTFVPTDKNPRENVGLWPSF